jgi:hypothetical protein
MLRKAAARPKRAAATVARKAAERVEARRAPDPSD